MKTHNIFEVIWRNPLQSAIVTLGTAAAVYHLISGFVILQGTLQFYITHVGLISVLALLAIIREKKKLLRYIAFVCVPLGIATILYIYLSIDRLEDAYQFISDLDFVVGILVIIPILFATWVWWGPAISLLTIVAMLYFFFGHLIPGPLGHIYFSPKYVVSYLTVGLNKGLFGQLTPTSANLTFYFMLLACMIQAMGVVPSFLEIGKAAGRVLRGGPAYMAVIGSAFVAMISGSGSANVVLTGSMTIPAMKASGFRPKDAAAIEAIASGGGQITPPVMGAAGFIMAAFVGVPYLIVMQKAVLGALIFYVTLIIGVIFMCYSQGAPKYVGSIDKKVILQRFPVFLIPVSVVMVALTQGFSVTLCTSLAVMITVALGVLFVRESRSLKTIIAGLSEGALMGARIGIALAIIGIVATVVIATGAGPKVGSAIASLTHGLWLPSMLLIAIVCILLGTGLPISADYTLVALLMLPSLWALGVDVFASHFFAFYFATIATVTPPVAPAAMVASRIAQAGFWATGFTTLKIVLVFLAFPIILARNPELLDFPFVGWYQVGIIMVVLLIAVMVAIVTHGWLFIRVGRIARIVSAIAAISLTAFCLRMGAAYLVIGFVLAALLTIFVLSIYFKRSRNQYLSPQPLPQVYASQGKSPRD